MVTSEKAKVHSAALKEFVKWKFAHNKWMPTEEILQYLPKCSNVVYETKHLSSALSKTFDFHFDRSQKDVDGVYAVKITKGVYVDYYSKKSHVKTFYYFLKDTPIQERDIPLDKTIYQKVWDNYCMDTRMMDSPPARKKQKTVGAVEDTTIGFHFLSNEIFIL